MGYSYEQELGFVSSDDKDGAIKFCLNQVLQGRLFEQLLMLLSDENGIEGFGGDPCWDLERRSPYVAENEGWPDWASFKATACEIYSLEHPETFYRRDDFLSFIERALKVYLDRHPDRRDDCVGVFNELQRIYSSGRSARC